MTEPFVVKTIKEMTSDELIALVAKRQDERLKPMPVIERTRKDAKEIDYAVISDRLIKAVEKLEKELDGWDKKQEKVQRALTTVVAMRSQLGLE